MNQNPANQKPNTILSLYAAHRKLGNLLVLGAFYAATASGGVADTVHDGLQDAGAVVMSIPETDRDPTPLEEREFDGIPFKEYPAKAQQGFKDDEQANFDAYSRVARTMADLDAHDYDAIKQRGDAYYETHHAEIMPDKAKVATIAALKSAQSPQQVLGALNTFMNFYNKNVTFLVENTHELTAFDSTVETKDVQKFALSVVRAFSPLPKQFITDGKFTDIELGKGKGTIAGAYNPYGGTDGRGSLRFAVTGIKKVGPVLNVMPNWLQDDISDSHTLLHELGHSKKPIHYGVPATDAEFGKGILVQAAQELIGRPGDVSQYATSDLGEHFAEVAAFAFDTTRGPNHPDEARRFSSGGNKEILSELADTEEIMPGFTDYLISRNDHLMRNPSIIPGR